MSATGGALLCCIKPIAALLFCRATPGLLSATGGALLFVSAALIYASLSPNTDAAAIEVCGAQGAHIHKTPYLFSVLWTGGHETSDGELGERGTLKLLLKFSYVFTP